MNRLERAKDRFESVLFILIAGGIVFFAVAGVISFAIIEWTHRATSSNVAVTIVFATLATAELFALKSILNSFNAGRTPLAPSFALEQRRWPPIMRPFVTLFWLAHFAAAVGLLVAIGRAETTDPEWQLMAMRSALALLGAFGTSYAAFLYLLVAVATVWKRERLIFRLWRLRLPADLALVVTTVLLRR